MVGYCLFFFTGVVDWLVIGCLQLTVDWYVEDDKLGSTVCSLVVF